MCLLVASAPVEQQKTKPKAFKYITVFNFSIATIPQVNCCYAVIESNSKGKEQSPGIIFVE